jgi:hypothetical protein
MRRHSSWIAPLALLGAALILPSSARAQVALSEVFYDAVGADDGAEWIELRNETDAPIELTGFSLGWGGANYLSGTVALSGTIEPHDYFVVGGPLSTPENGSPVFDLAVDLESDLQNSGAVADGVAIFDVPLEELVAETLPLDAVIYGEENTSGLVDATGLPAPVDVADAPAGSSIERGADGVWRVQPSPTPGAPPQVIPEPPGSVLAAASSAALAALSGQRAARSKKTRWAL